MSMKTSQDLRDLICPQIGNPGCIPRMRQAPALSSPVIVRYDQSMSADVSEPVAEGLRGFQYSFPCLQLWAGGTHRWGSWVLCLPCNQLLPASRKAGDLGLLWPWLLCEEECFVLRM